MKSLGFFLSIVMTICCGAECTEARLELFYSPYCYYSHKVLDYLDKEGKTVPLRNVVTDKEAKGELKKKGGKMQVPCLLIGDYPLYESDLIIEWLSEHLECLQEKPRAEALGGVT